MLCGAYKSIFSSSRNNRQCKHSEASVNNTEETDRILTNYLTGEVDDDNDRYHIGKVMLKTLKKFGNRINQIDVITGKKETHESVLKRSIKCAIWMRENGIKIGDVILLSANNHLDSCIPAIAALYLGAVPFPVDVNLKAIDLAHYLKLGEPKMVICDPTAILDNVKMALRELNIQPKVVLFQVDRDKEYTTFVEIMAISDSKYAEFRPTDLDPKIASAMILCTSGSTGQPKGVAITHKAFLVNLMQLWSIDKYPYYEETILVASGLHWYSGPAMMMTACVLGATKVQSSESFNLNFLYKAIKDYRPTCTFLGPAIVLAYLAQKEYEDTDWSSFGKLLIGGSSIAPALLKKMQDKLGDGKVSIVYGNTESCGIITKCFHQPNDNVSIGKIEPNVHLKIVDVNGETLGPNQPGEAFMKGDFIFKEYYRDPIVTSEAMTKDKWFKTGDVLYYDEDGYYYFVDRLKTMMKYKANQVAPAELESVIQNHPAVELVVVDRYEVPPDDLAVALIKVKPNYDVSAQEIKDLVKDSLAWYKQLHGGVFFVDSFPTLASGKIDRQKIRHIIKTYKLSHGVISK